MNKMGWPHLVYAYGEKRSHYGGNGETLFRGGGKASGERGTRWKCGNGTRILAFSNDEITDTAEICDNPYAEVEWIA